MSGIHDTETQSQGTEVEILLDPEAAGILYGVTGRTMRNLAARGTVPAVRLPGLRSVRFRPSSLLRLAAEYEALEIDAVQIGGQ